ncbi:MAG: hypothetical protein ACXVYW_05510 [Oryzihumus sp.]
MEKPVQWMTIDELRVELERTHLAWQSQVENVDSFLGTGELPPQAEEAFRHRLVADELARRASEEA